MTRLATSDEMDLDEHRRFAAVHLAGALEAAVYDALAGAPALDWTPRELAGHLQAPLAAVRAALRRFAAAGILDARPGPAVTSYRFAATARFLGEAASPDAVRDPVCGMWVAPTTTYRLETATGTELFCSQGCLARWHATHDGGPPASP